VKEKVNTFSNSYRRVLSMISPQPAAYLTSPSALDDLFSVLIPSGLKKKASVHLRRIADAAGF
jgi:hypothetical protein